MFTGLIQSIGTVVQMARNAGGARLVIDTGLAPELLALGDSIAVDGCCQTIAALDGARCTFHALNETLDRTIFGEYAAGRRVNIEPALAAGERLGGHIVQGHIDCVGRIVSIAQRNGDIALTLTRPEHASFPLVEKG